MAIPPPPANSNGNSGFLRTGFLTPVDLSILDFLSQGFNAQEIAVKLISERGQPYSTRSIEARIAKMQKKMEVKNSVHLVARALRLKIIL